MKIEVRVPYTSHIERVPYTALFNFLRDAGVLPATLEAYSKRDDYGLVQYIILPGNWLRQLIFGPKHRIACVYEETVDLYRPEYFSVFKDMLRRYEHATGREATLIVWES